MRLARQKALEIQETVNVTDTSRVPLLDGLQILFHSPNNFSILGENPQEKITQGATGEAGIAELHGEMIGQSGLNGIVSQDRGNIVIGQDGFLLNIGAGLVLHPQPHIITGFFIDVVDVIQEPAGEVRESGSAVFDVIVDMIVEVGLGIRSFCSGRVNTSSHGESAEGVRLEWREKGFGNGWLYEKFCGHRNERCKKMGS